ncbi:MAG: SemiSWEET transporter [Terracidiphilus sp.]|jgi:MtN3 and saliva related transmembrane protein
MSVHWITDSVGLLAGFCTTACLVPQLHSIWRSKSAHGISAAMFLVMGLGAALWLTYGIAIRSLPVIVANSATLALIVTILTLKMRYDRGH